MGIMVTKDTERNAELNRRITADLRAKVQSSRDEVDGVNDSAYIKDTKKTSKFGWVWIILIVLAIISLGCIIFI